MIFDTIIQFLLGSLAIGAVVIIILLFAKIFSYVNNHVKVTSEDVILGICLTISIPMFIVLSIIVGSIFYP